MLAHNDHTPWNFGENVYIFMFLLEICEKKWLFN